MPALSLEKITVKVNSDEHRMIAKGVKQRRKMEDCLIIESVIDQTKKDEFPDETMKAIGEYEHGEYEIFHTPEDLFQSWES